MVTWQTDLPYLVTDVGNSDHAPDNGWQVEDGCQSEMLDTTHSISEHCCVAQTKQ